MKNEIIQLGGKSYVKAKVVRLSTKKESNIQLHNGNLIFYNRKREYGDSSMQHLYFLSEEEIKGGDWWINIADTTLGARQATQQDIDNIKKKNATWCKKIIATTDELLKHEVESGQGVGTIKYFIPRPSNEFLQAYCKANGKIEEVLVEVEGYYSGNGGTDSNFTASAYSYFIGYKLKLSPDNTITTKRVDGRMHSNAEVRELFIKAAKSNLFEGGWKTDLSIKILDKWISENL